MCAMPAGEGGVSTSNLPVYGSFRCAEQQASQDASAVSLLQAIHWAYGSQRRMRPLLDAESHPVGASELWAMAYVVRG